MFAVILFVAVGAAFVSPSSRLPYCSVIETRIGSAILVCMLLAAVIGVLFVRFRKR